MLRCCGAGDNGCNTDGWPGGQRHPTRWMRRRLRSDSSEPVTDDRRPKYRRVSGRTTSSVELPADEDDDDEACNGGGRDCWRRVVATGSVGGRDDGGNATGRPSYCSTNGAAGSDGRDGRDSVIAPASHAAVVGGVRGQRPTKAAPAIALSNWTVISNSSLKDVDGDDLHDELVGYEVDASAHRVTAPVTMAGCKNGISGEND